MAIGACCFLCVPRTTAENSVSTNQTLIVGIEVAPPFVIKHDDGSWEGISIDLWRHIADQLHLKYEFREMSLTASLDAVASNRIDAAVGAITITADRQMKADFTHSFYTSGLAIGVRRPSDEHEWLGILSGFFTISFFEVVVALLLVMTAAAFTIWWCERKVNRAQFGGRWWEGLGSGLWWSAAAITTTGYGDKAPRTFAGRLLAVFWTFTGLVIIASFIATVTASLTVRHLRENIRGFEDLPHRRVAIIANTTSETYLRQHKIAVLRYQSGEAAIQALVEGQVDAFVDDTPLLLYRAKQMQNAIVVLPQTFDPQGYGIALPSNNPLYKSVDIALLETISDPVWQQILDEYLSSPER